MLRVQKEHRERLRFARLLMVLSSLAPLFVLMAIRGNGLFPDVYFVVACAALAIVPSIFLWWRACNAQKQNDTRTLVTGSTEDHRGHILVYLFATLLPFYREEITSYRDLAAICAGLGLIVFLFWRLNLHYLNLLFAIFRYQVFTVLPPEDGNPYTGQESFVLITRRRQLRKGEMLVAFRLSDTVYLEKKLT